MNNYNTNSLLCELAALKLGEGGVKVFRLAPNTKIPLKKSSGYQDATNDSCKILDWFAKDTEQSPELGRVNIGIKLDGMIVLDVDNHGGGHDGTKSLIKLSRSGKTLPANTYIEKTPHGLHYFYKYTGKPTRKINVMAGLDILTDFVTAAPSQIDGESYEQISGTPDIFHLAPAPYWLIDLLDGKSDIKKPFIKTVKPSKFKSKIAGELIEALISEVGQGGRNDYLTHVCGLLLSAKTDPENALEALRKMNEINCTPPLEDKELQTIFRSILKNENSKERATK